VPVVNSSQARIDLSFAQYRTLGTVLARAQIAGAGKVPMLSFKETNIEGSIVLISKYGMTLIDQNGLEHDFKQGALPRALYT
jgi:hypothetical protein